MKGLVGALTEPVDVRLIEDGDCWEPFLVPLAIILAGLIAAGLTWLIHRQSLEAEDRRLRRTFRHERQMRNRDAARATLNQAVETIAEINDAVTDYSSGVHARARVLSQVDPELSDDEREHLTEQIAQMESEIRSDFIQAGKALHKGPPMRFRLQMAFIDDDEIVGAFERWYTATWEVHDKVRTAAQETPLDPEAFERIKDSTGAHLSEFLEAARAWMYEFEADPADIPDEHAG